MNPDRLAAMLRLLLDSGDITPMGVRLLTQVNTAEEAIAEGE